MNFIGFKDYPDTSTPLNAAYMTAFLNAMYPVGKIEMFYDSENHSNFLGFKWERTMIGRSPIGLDINDNDFKFIGSTGGAKQHCLTIQEMPSHTHNVNLSSTSSENENKLVTSSWTWSTQNQENNNLLNPTGENVAHNNLHPYEIVAFWKRIE